MDVENKPQEAEAKTAQAPVKAKPKTWVEHWGDVSTAIAKSWGLYLAALGVAVASFGGVWAFFGSHGRIGILAFIAVLAIPVLLAFLTDTLPRLREQRRMDRLREDGISGTAVPAGYFRLRPYDAADHDGFKRADAAHQQVVAWVKKAKVPLLYLTGRSGTGKSSLLNAWVLPELAPREFGDERGFHHVSARSFGDPIKALLSALKAPDAVWDRRPPKDTVVRAVLEKAAKKVAPQRLLVLLDQFEEFLILHKPEERKAMEALLKSLMDEPIEGLTVLVVLRSDYINELSKLDIPALRADENWFEVGPFTRADTRDFLVGSNLKVSREMLESILDEAGEIEDNPGLIRPITANMLGVVLERFRGGLPIGTQPGSLLRDYLKEKISQQDIADHAPKILEDMISDAGTKSPKSEEELAKATTFDEALVRGCLVQLGRPGLVREIDPEARIWEVAHDFVARLLGQLVARAKPRLWTRLRPILTPTSLAVWLVLLFGAYPAFQAYQYNATQRLLAKEGVTIIQNDEGGHRLDYTGCQGRRLCTHTALSRPPDTDP